jgi:aminopeptidase N
VPLMLPEARERATLVTDVRTQAHLDLTSSEDFGVEAPGRVQPKEIVA